jgi:hypothetical protein
MKTFLLASYFTSSFVSALKKEGGIRVGFPITEGHALYHAANSPELNLSRTPEIAVLHQTF